MEHHSSSRSGTTFSRTCFNGLNSLAGLGILSIPYALAQTGWTGLLLLLLTSLTCFYTAILLQKCMDSDSNAKTYPDVGELAFGFRGRIIVSIFMYLELYLVAVELLILEGDNLEKLFPSTNFHIGRLHIKCKQGFVLLAAFIVLPTTWLRSLGLLAYVSFGNILSSLVLVFCVFWAGAVDGVGFAAEGDIVRLRGVPTALSLYAFCYSGHSVFPTLYTSMRDKTKFSKALFLCFALCTMNYGAMAVMGYLMYGQSAKSQVTLNLPVNKLSSKIAIYTTLIIPLTRYALLVTPISNSMEEWLQISTVRSISILIRTVLVMSTVLVALSVPFYGYVLELTGSFLCSAATMILPCMCYLKIYRSRKDYWINFVVILGVMCMGAFIAVFGTYGALKKIIMNL